MFTGRRYYEHNGEYASRDIRSRRESRFQSHISVTLLALLLWGCNVGPSDRSATTNIPKHVGWIAVKCTKSSRDVPTDL